MQTTTAKSYGLDGKKPLFPDTEGRFLFIEGEHATHQTHYTSYFPESIQAKDFEQATQLLSSGDFFPDLVVINQPIDYKNLISFKIWLANQEATIPIIYNEEALSQDEIKKLYRQKMVDDITNLEKNYTSLPQKASFLKKMAAHVKDARGKNTHNGDGLSFTHIVMRIFDILVSGAALLLLSPVFLLIALIIKLESKGPVIYSSPRAGRGFRVFKFYKFRSMVADADKKVKDLQAQNMYAGDAKGPNFFKVKNDPRITRFGSMLRNSSLDELPQLFNVLKGDMSIVGNRPLPLYEAVSLTTDEWAERFMAPAGITGLWQVSKRGKEEMSNEERISLDIDYARTRSLGGDFKIMLKTPTALLQKTNV
ncbi:MAG: sugar transferase [Ferruginibacter sp.]